MIFCVFFSKSYAYLLSSFKSRLWTHRGADPEKNPRGSNHPLEPEIGGRRQRVCVITVSLTAWDSACSCYFPSLWVLFLFLCFHRWSDVTGCICGPWKRREPQTTSWLFTSAEQNTKYFRKTYFSSVVCFIFAAKFNLIRGKL